MSESESRFANRRSERVPERWLAARYQVREPRAKWQQRMSARMDLSSHVQMLHSTRRRRPGSRRDPKRSRATRACASGIHRPLRSRPCALPVLRPSRHKSRRSRQEGQGTRERLLADGEAPLKKGCLRQCAMSNSARVRSCKPGYRPRPTREAYTFGRRRFPRWPYLRRRHAWARSH